jgi:hypothetical protein
MSSEKAEGRKQKAERKFLYAACVLLAVLLVAPTVNAFDVEITVTIELLLLIADGAIRTDAEH